ncbi:hypothetical protein B0T11DRAFT_14726 [Plectosphaerella cucumerina]|uniref:Uncharacterized protein n=1 Tax=Plectosphaerella cucumerina TaxID=40658 RepID=A0A8K0TRA5_9PEZI|nr:hypothetical protein B0T11DRAFT_14726 [Plectosphaerella cucumerina]
MNGREERRPLRHARRQLGLPALSQHLHFVCQTDADRWPSTPVMRANRSCDSASGGLAISQALYCSGIVGLHPRLLHPATVASLLSLLSSPRLDPRLCYPRPPFSDLPDMDLFPPHVPAWVTDNDTRRPGFWNNPKHDASPSHGTPSGLGDTAQCRQGLPD